MMRRYVNSPRIAFGGLIVLGLTISGLAHFESRFPGDLHITLLFQSINNQPLLITMRGISYVTGEWRAAIVLVVSAIIVWRCLGVFEGGAVVLSGLIAIINEVFKIVINRPRPTADLVSVFVVETGASFPSGHAFFAVVALGMLAYLTVNYQSRRYLRILVASGFFILILWIGASRVYLGAHWTSDVIGGYVAGSLFLVLEIWLYERFKFSIEKKRALSGGQS